MRPTAGNPFIDLTLAGSMDLQSDHRFPAAGHLWSRSEIDALILAYAARRPLLVRGEAGSGKSQIARAAAKAMGNAPLLVEVIHPRFEALDLLYRFDAVRRLADAQQKQLRRTDEKYVKPGRLWEAMELMKKQEVTPVLLIDEIDKADSDVPNALLDVLGNRSFTVPYLNDRTIRAPDGRLPLIILTTNEERELPAAFVRRCVVLNLNPPAHESEDGKAAFVNWLVERGNVHKHLAIVPEASEMAARQVLADREASISYGYPKVGLAEYIDLLTALDELTQDSPVEQRVVEQIEWLDRLSAYALVKNAGQRQDRAPVQQVASSSTEAAGP